MTRADTSCTRCNYCWPRRPRPPETASHRATTATGLAGPGPTVDYLDWGVCVCSSHASLYLVLDVLPVVVVVCSHAAYTTHAASVAWPLSTIGWPRGAPGSLYESCTHTLLASGGSLSLSSALASDHARGWRRSRAAAMTKAHIHSVVPR